MPVGFTALSTGPCVHGVLPVYPCEGALSWVMGGSQWTLNPHTWPCIHGPPSRAGVARQPWKQRGGPRHTQQAVLLLQVPDTCASAWCGPPSATRACHPMPCLHPAVSHPHGGPALLGTE